MANVILNKLVNTNPSDLPEFYKNLDKESFGISWKLHDYQQDALKCAINTLYYYFTKKEELINHYKANVNQEWLDEIAYTDKNPHFGLLNQFYVVEENKISFDKFINRASLWMATGSGKTLVLVKLIEFLYQLATNGHIPKNDILILAPKPEILKQINEHIEIFNKNGNLKINLKDLREFEKQKHLQPSLYDANSITVFYYRSDNITDNDKTELLSYETVLNGGKWYVLLDEAHKGDKQDSIRQAYYAILAHKGFIFNFSATFTDAMDIVSTAYNFNLKKFVESGYGKHITVSGEEYKNWKKKKNKEFSVTEKTAMVVKSLLVLTAIKKETEFIKSFHPELYHNPLLITIANEVNTVDAELKLFFAQLAIIASGQYDLDTAKEQLITDLIENKHYQFEATVIPPSFIQIIRHVSKVDILKNVFNATSHGKIEYTKINNNQREVAFRLKTAETGKHFCLLVASDATKWGNNVLEDYEYSETPLTKSYFKTINSTESGINILLGSRIFSEGWDSNRPNVVNFINIGVDEGAQKFVLQAIGRGVRIQPIPGVRKRLDHITGTDESQKLNSFINLEEKAAILKRNLPLESLFIFATKKEVIKNITENLNRERDADEWRIIKNFERTKIPKDLLIPKYNEVAGKIPAFSIDPIEYEELLNLVGEQESYSDKILLMECSDNVSKNIISTLFKIRNKKYFNFNTSHSGKAPMDNLLWLNSHFHQKPKKLKEYQPVLTEINHFEKFEVANLPEKELENLEEAILTTFQSNKLKYNTVEELGVAYKNDDITIDVFQEQLELFKKKGNSKFTFENYEVTINTHFLAEHYYNPILITTETYQKLFKHIIWVDSEIKFLTKLNEHRKILDKYEWWYFSKLDQATDDVSIPYYDSLEQEFRSFFPDFVFWLKLKNEDKYIIKFIDPKGNRLGTGNAEDKANGYENIFRKSKITYKEKNVEVELYFYNDSAGVPASLAPYFTKDFNKMF